MREATAFALETSINGANAAMAIGNALTAGIRGYQEAKTEHKASDAWAARAGRAEAEVIRLRMQMTEMRTALAMAEEEGDELAAENAKLAAELRLLRGRVVRA